MLTIDKFIEQEMRVEPVTKSAATDRYEKHLPGQHDQLKHAGRGKYPEYETKIGLYGGGAPTLAVDYSFSTPEIVKSRGSISPNQAIDQIEHEFGVNVNLTKLELDSRDTLLANRYPDQLPRPEDITGFTHFRSVPYENEVYLAYDLDKEKEILYSAMSDAVYHEMAHAAFIFDTIENWDRINLLMRSAKMHKRLPSKYAGKDPQEFVAESVTLWMLDKEIIEKMMPEAKTVIDILKKTYAEQKSMPTAFINVIFPYPGEPIYLDEDDNMIVKHPPGMHDQKTHAGTHQEVDFDWEEEAEDDETSDNLTVKDLPVEEQYVQLDHMRLLNEGHKMTGLENEPAVQHAERWQKEFEDVVATAKRSRAENIPLATFKPNKEDIEEYNLISEAVYPKPITIYNVKNWSKLPPSDDGTYTMLVDRFSDDVLATNTSRVVHDEIINRAAKGKHYDDFVRFRIRHGQVESSIFNAGVSPADIYEKDMSDEEKSEALLNIHEALYKLVDVGMPETYPVSVRMAYRMNPGNFLKISLINKSAVKAEYDNPYISLIEKLGSISVWRVDGEFIRDHIDIEFTDFGQHYHFKFIPDNEFWLDVEAEPGDEQYYIDHLLIEHRLMSEGTSYDKALAKADAAEKKEREKNTGRKPLKSADEIAKQVKIKFIGRIENIPIWLVDSEKVRELSGYVDFTEGGHGFVYPFVPKVPIQIWIDNDLKEEERWPVIVHEFTEIRAMEKGLDYPSAHKLANLAELEVRSKVEKHLPGQHNQRNHAGLSRKPTQEYADEAGVSGKIYDKYRAVEVSHIDPEKFFSEKNELSTILYNLKTGQLFVGSSHEDTTRSQTDPLGKDFQERNELYTNLQNNSVRMWLSHYQSRARPTTGVGPHIVASTVECGALALTNRVQAFNNMHDAFDKLVAVGLPSTTKVLIRDYYNPGPDEMVTLKHLPGQKIIEKSLGDRYSGQGSACFKQDKLSSMLQL